MQRWYNLYSPRKYWYLVGAIDVICLSQSYKFREYVQISLGIETSDLLHTVLSKKNEGESLERALATLLSQKSECHSIESLFTDPWRVFFKYNVCVFYQFCIHFLFTRFHRFRRCIVIFIGMFFDGFSVRTPTMQKPRCLKTLTIDSHAFVRISLLH